MNEEYIRLQIPNLEKWELIYIYIYAYIDRDDEEKQIYSDELVEHMIVPAC